MTPAGFGYRSARSGAVTGGLALAVVVEAVGVHLWLRARHPTLAWALAALSVLTLAWLAFEFHAWGTGRIRVDATRVVLRIAGRARADVPRAGLTVVRAPGWRERPAPGAPGYVNLTGPTEPNVLLVSSAPVSVRLLGGVVRRAATTLGLHVDAPDAFADAVEAPDPGESGRGAGSATDDSAAHAASHA